MFSDPRLASPLSTSTQTTALLNPLPATLSTIATASLAKPLTMSPSFSGSSGAANAILGAANATNSAAALTLFGGNSISTATNVGALALTGTPLSINSFVGGLLTPNDYYKFTVGATTNLNLDLTGLSSNAAVQLLNSAGLVMATSNYGSNHDQALNLAGVTTGTYYVRVYDSGSMTNFTLGLSATAPGTPSNLLPIQTEVGHLAATSVFNGSVNNTDTANVYEFQLASAGHFDLTLSGLSADADVRLIRDVNGNRIVDSGDELVRSQQAGPLAESISLTNLAAGDYYVEVYQYSGNTNYHLSLSTGDWFSSNLQDAGIIGEARYGMAADGGIKRNDMLSIFNEVEKEGTVSSAALTNLRTLVNYGASFSMPDYVQQLAGDVVNSNVANTYYQDAALGNLVAGSSSSQLGKLVDKWFLGSDLPASYIPATSGSFAKSITYGSVSGTLFGTDGSPNITDIQQGDLGDCYFLASLGATVLQDPSAIQHMFINNGDGTFTVRLFPESNGVPSQTPDYVTVDLELPISVYDYGYPTAPQHFAAYNQTIGLWVALAEKAYAQFAEEGVSQRNNANPNGSGQGYVPNSYGSIEDGWGLRAMPSLTGRSAGYFAATPITSLAAVNGNNYLGTLPTSPTIALQAIASELAQGDALIADTKGATSQADIDSATGIVLGHEYVIGGVNFINGTLTLYNPWGDNDTSTGDSNGIKVISYSNFLSDFTQINVG